MSRKQVIEQFKSLHRTAQKLFRDDEYALNSARIRINDEFRKYRHVKDENSIKELVKLAKEVEHELKTNVIQAKSMKPNVYEAKITPETTKLDNVMFQADAVLLTKKDRHRKCGDKT